MHRFIWKRLSVTLVDRSSIASSPNSKTLLSPQILRLLSSISTTSDDTDNDNCTEQQSSYRPSSAIRLFEDFGFSQTQIERIASRYPEFLRCTEPQKTLKPKIDFLHSIGIPEDHVVKMVTQFPRILSRSLNNHLIPTFDSLKSLFGGEENAIWLVKRCPFVFHRNMADTMAVNLSTLRKHGVLEANILKMMTQKVFTEIMEHCKPDRFIEIVESLMNMGFDTSSPTFGRAITAMGLGNESTWEENIKFYQGLGFSREEFFSMFKKQPILATLSQKNVREAAEFFFNKLHLGPSELAMRPLLLMYSLHKRVIPRCSVLQVLWSRNMIKKSIVLLNVLQFTTEEAFLEKYVTKYQVEFPEVLNAYRGKLHFEDFTFVPGKNHDPKAV